MLRITACIIGILLATACLGAPVTIVTGDHPSSLETIAAKELQKYMCALSGELPRIKTKASGTIIAVGTPASNPLVRKFKPDLSTLGDQGYLLRTVKDGGRSVLLVTGNTPTAVTYGAYSLLEEMGIGFYLGGDAIPAKKPFALPKLNISRKPVFEIRGTLPWYNFFDSPTTWDYQDYCWFFDNLVKTKNNFIGFHAYDYEPFCAYQEDGKYVYGEPIATTAVPTWGTHPMKTSEFGFGTGKYFPDEYFGSKPGQVRDDRERSIKDSQDLLKKALDYAHYRGLKTCVGFEVTGYDPTDPRAVEVLEKRLKHLVAQYPMLDYVWIWEVEAVGVHGADPPALDSRFGSYYRRWEPTFAYLGEPRKIAEAVRLALYTREAHRILKEIAPNMRLILSGWGGDNWLHVSDFYPGLDQIVPKDVIFSALDNIIVSPTVSAAYGKLSPDRERWPIPWFEYDGDQWHNQANAKQWLGACRDSLAKGCQGILGIHWRTRDVEESHAMMSQFAWDPKMTYEQFYLTYAEKTFGPKHAAEMAKVLMDLQALGYRWVGGHGQTECGNFGWGSPADPEKIRKLTEIQARAQAVLEDLRKTLGAERYAGYASYLRDTIDWTLRYEQTAQMLIQDGEVYKLLVKARSEKSAGNDVDAAKTASLGLKKLADCDFGAALDACARRVTDKGAMGMLATVNTKAYWAYRDVVNELSTLAGATQVLEPTPIGTTKFPAWSGLQPITCQSVPASRPKPAPKLTPAILSNARVEPGDGCALVLKWSGPLTRCEISRSENGGPFTPIATVTDNWFEDRDVFGGKEYRYSITPLSQGKSGKAIMSPTKSPSLLNVAPPSVTYTAFPGKIRLEWAKSPMGVGGYSVYQSASANGPWESLTAKPKSADNWRVNMFPALAEAQKPMYYKVVALDKAGAELAAAEPVLCTAKPGSPAEPFLALDFSGLTGGRSDGMAYIEQVNGVHVLHVSSGGSLILPHRPEFDTGGEITIALWAKLDSLGNMPVLLSHGQWSVDGYFIQQFGGRIRFNLQGVGTLDAGSVEPGKWHHIVGTYDGAEMVLYMNGQPVGRTFASGTIIPTGRNLYIGRYEIAGAEYETECRITGVKLYATGLLPDQVKQEYLRLADKLR